MEGAKEKIKSTETRRKYNFWKLFAITLLLLVIVDAFLPKKTASVTREVRVQNLSSAVEYGRVTCTFNTESYVALIDKELDGIKVGSTKTIVHLAPSKETNPEVIKITGLDTGKPMVQFSNASTVNEKVFANITENTPAENLNSTKKTFTLFVPNTVAGGGDIITVNKELGIATWSTHSSQVSISPQIEAITSIGECSGF